ncbi:hypothetical protein E4P40_08060 [Blastococcus sp. CT_GayMR20]|uniref:hypothetical protein n=1 Tax=Blastococcus sp. CT_GayMR20 TaxID=2559609 RepID=UPI00107327B9|nr:hypothetical protein [Blastococcus sp. CT_GayMR20]TFV89727.1 hypothetical protein E4P40_07935 [Blastococcus sp. CT_GayMR20]TFV89748.1 hypothetical protein E4P40_08060 [Blastococcus sp. CT_GayMR20]
MARLRATTLTALVLAMTSGGCGAQDGAGEPLPDGQRSAGCPGTPPGGRTDVDDGTGGQLVPTASDPVLLTLCVYGLVPVSPPPGSGPNSTPEPPATRTWAGADLHAAVDELNGLPVFSDSTDHVCNAAIWPGYVLVLDHADGTTTTLTVDRSCALVSDGDGAVRLGLPSMVAAAP